MIIEGSRLPAGSGSENAEDEITSRTQKERIHLALETAQANTRASRVTHYFLMLLILGNVIAVILESMRPLKRQFATVFWGFEFLSVGVFTFEYILRLWTCTADERYRSRFWGRVKFARTPLALIDLIAIAPFYLPFVVVDLRVLRAMRLFRILRVLKFGRYSDAFRLLAKVIRSKRQDLIATTTVLAILLIVAASMMYEAESAAQPDKFSSIPEAMWWAVVTTARKTSVAALRMLGTRSVGSNKRRSLQTASAC